MTVRELIERLQQADPDALVVLSRDPEGNGYSALGQIRLDNMYVADNDGYSGEVYPTALTDAMRESGWTDADLFDAQTVYAGQTASPAVVLWPE